MEIWEHLRILEDKGWFLRQSDDKRIETLTKISRIGNPSAIQFLVPYLKNGSRNMQVSTCNAIMQLFNNHKTKKYLYECLKNCNITESDILFFKQNFQPNSI